MKTIEIKNHLCLDTTDERKELLINIGLSYFVYGYSVIEQLKNKYQNAKILMDLKISNNDYLNAKIAFDAGADFVSLLASTTNQCIANTLKIAEENQKEIIIDLNGVTDLNARLEDLSILGVHSIMKHHKLTSALIDEYLFDVYDYKTDTFQFINDQLSEIHEQI